MFKTTAAASPDDHIDALEPREADRVKRRDRTADAKAREPMRTGMGKVFKQIQDAQAKAAKEAQVKPPSPRRKPRAARRKGG
jgi:hypothetical protein